MGFEGLRRVRAVAAGCEELRGRHVGVAGFKFRPGKKTDAPGCGVFRKVPRHLFAVSVVVWRAYMEVF